MILHSPRTRYVSPDHLEALAFVNGVTIDMGGADPSLLLRGIRYVAKRSS